MKLCKGNKRDLSILNRINRRLDDINKIKSGLLVVSDPHKRILVLEGEIMILRSSMVSSNA